MAGSIRNLLFRDGRYFARVVVPVTLRPKVGKSELRTPLGADRRAALKALPAALALILDQIASARSAKDRAPRHRPLATAELARQHYIEGLDRDERVRDMVLPPPPAPEPGEAPDVYVTGPRHYDASYNRIFAPAYVAALRRVAGGQASDEEIDAVIGWAIERFAERGNFAGAKGSREWRGLGRTLASVQIEIQTRSVERDGGNFAGEPTYPPLTTGLAQPPIAPPTPLPDLFKGYMEELAANGKGREAARRWRPVIADLRNFLGHDDANRITRADLVRWKDAKLASLSPKTFRDVHLASIRAVFSWALDNGRVKRNPTTGIRVRVARKTTTRERGFTAEEARAVLAAASAYVPPVSANPRTREAPQTTAAKRWTPWLCAYTGARVAEITQLRKEDVREAEGIPYMRITPEAGSVKSGQYRDVPLHSHLIELGFLEFVTSSKCGPLFFRDGDRRGDMHPSKQVAGRLSNWIRSLKIIDEGVAPNVTAVSIPPSILDRLSRVCLPEWEIGLCLDLSLWSSLKRLT